MDWLLEEVELLLLLRNTVGDLVLWHEEGLEWILDLLWVVWDLLGLLTVGMDGNWLWVEKGSEEVEVLVLLVTEQ